MNFKLFRLGFAYKDKKGNDRIGYNYYLVSENGTTIRIYGYTNTFKGDDGKERVIDETPKLHILSTEVFDKTDLVYGNKE